MSTKVAPAACVPMKKTLGAANTAPNNIPNNAPIRIPISEPMTSDKSLLDLCSGLNFARERDRSVIEAVKSLIPEDVRRRDSRGNTALIALVANGRRVNRSKMEIAKCLIPYEAGLCNDSGWTALMVVAANYRFLVNAAERHRLIELVTLLAPHEAGRYDENGYTALMLLLKKEYSYGFPIAELADILKPYEAGLRHIPTGATALHLHWINESTTDIFDILADKEGSIVDKEFETPLHKAIASMYYTAINNPLTPEIIHSLITLYPSMTTTTGLTPLMIDAICNNPLKSSHIERYGGIQDRAGSSALMYLMRHSSIASDYQQVSLLIDKEAGLQRYYDKTSAICDWMKGLIYQVRTNSKIPLLPQEMRTLVQKLAAKELSLTMHNKSFTIYRHVYEMASVECSIMKISRYPILEMLTSDETKFVAYGSLRHLAKITNISDIISRIIPEDVMSNYLLFERNWENGQMANLQIDTLMNTSVRIYLTFVSPIDARVIECMRLNGVKCMACLKADERVLYSPCRKCKYDAICHTCISKTNHTCPLCSASYF